MPLNYPDDDPQWGTVTEEPPQELENPVAPEYAGHADEAPPTEEQDDGAADCISQELQRADEENSDAPGHAYYTDDVPPTEEQDDGAADCISPELQRADEENSNAPGHAYYTDDVPPTEEHDDGAADCISQELPHADEENLQLSYVKSQEAAEEHEEPQVEVSQFPEEEDPQPEEHEQIEQAKSTEKCPPLETYEIREHETPPPEEAYEGEKAEKLSQPPSHRQDYAKDKEAHATPQHAYEEAPSPYAQAQSISSPRLAAAPPSAIVKPRTRTVKAVVRWEPVEHDTRDSSDDEFELSTCMAPVYEGEGDEGDESVSVFKNGGPDYEGEIMSCFDEPNLLYRITNPKEKTWAFYNDSLHYEMHVRFVFGKHSRVQPLENTTMHQNEEGQYVMEVVVYPTETEMFLQGSVNGFTSKLHAVPLTDGYHNARRMIAEEQVSNEMAAIQQVTSSDNAEDVLQVCIENGIPFVDPEFPPCQASLDTGASKPFMPLAWARPQMFLPEEMASQVRLFRAKVKPGCVDAGDLGDSWLMCSVASLTEDPVQLMGMFRHPEGKVAAQREHAVGAYRVTFNKNGWWRSVVVDSYLPVSGGKLKYAKSATDPAEIWPAILQKAYAKLHGSYAKICSGDPLHALQDMTGFSTMRFDDSLRDDKTSDGLFKELVNGIKVGYTVICSTPGRGSHDKDQELYEAYAQVGLATGHAYTILEARHIESKDLRIVKARNAWGRGTGWKGNWSNDDTTWDANPDVAEECNFTREEDGTFWMSWRDAQKYFNGGGVCFSHQPVYDYRINCVFTDNVPSTVLEIEVQSPSWFTFVISQDDKRCQASVCEYKPVMISIAEPVEGDMYKVVMNSSANGAQPTPVKWTFLQARDISLIHKLDAGKYLVVPRIMPLDDATESVPYVLGMICNKEVGGGDVSVKFKRLDAANRVFENFPKFEPELLEVEQPVQYQRRAPGEGFPMTQMGEELV